MPSSAASEAGEETASGAMPTDPGLDSPPNEPHIDREVPNSPENESNKSPAASVASTRSETETQSSSGSESESDMGYNYDEFSFLFNAAPPPPPPQEVNRRLGRARAKRPVRYVQTAISQHIDDHGTLLKNLSDRIGILEYEIEKIGQTPRGLPPPPPLNLPPVYPMIEYGNLQWFNRRIYQRFNPEFSLEVHLATDTNGLCSFFANHQGVYSGTEEFGPVPTLEGTNLLPDRIRIASFRLMKCLSEINNEISPIGGNLVFVPPFKTFVTYENGIRAMAKNTEVEVDSMRQRELLRSQQKTSIFEEDKKGSCGVPKDNDSHPANPSGSADLDSEQNSVEFEYLQSKCEDLRLLVQFLDGSFKPILNLYHSIKAGAITQIPFDYLWYLFDHGQEVVQQGRHPQVSRVLRFTGGRNTITAVESTGVPNFAPVVEFTEKVRQSITKSAFHIDCYCWEFDGEGFKPVVGTIHIKPYAGFRDITSLPVYPLAFHERGDMIRQQLIERGDKFLSLAKKNEVVHRHYTGLTIESNCTNAEEVCFLS